MNEKEITVFMWEKLLFNYYEDWKGNTKGITKNMKLQAEMACELIPMFLKDLGVKTIEVNRVSFYNYNIKWDEFELWMKEHHPFVKVEIWNGTKKE